MVHVGNVWVSVLESPVTVYMRVWLAGWVVGPMLVLVMRIVDVGMRVFHRFVNVFMFVVLGDV